MIRLIAGIIAASLILGGCGTIPAWLSVTMSGASYLASVNKIGADYFEYKTKEEEKISAKKAASP